MQPLGSGFLFRATSVPGGSGMTEIRGGGRVRGVPVVLLYLGSLGKSGKGTFEWYKR